MKKFILKKISVLSLFSIFIILSCLKFLIFDYGELDDIGFVLFGTYVFIGIGLFGLLLDYILSLLSKNRVALNIIELIIILLVWFSFKYKLGLGLMG